MRGQDHDLTTAQQEKYEMSCWEEGVSSQLVDRIKTIAREDEVLAKSRAREESSCQCIASSSPASSMGGTRRTGAQQEDMPSSGGKETRNQQHYGGREGEQARQPGGEDPAQNNAQLQLREHEGEEEE